MLFIVRTLESILYPVGFVWLCLVVMTIAFWRKKLPGPAKGCGALAVFLYVTGATPVPEFLVAQLERPFANSTVANAAPADVVIVLGGNVNPSTHDSFEISLNSSADRIVTGIELLRQKKAGALIIGGGTARIATKEISEGKRVENWLTRWGVAPGEVIGLPACVNTREEALRSRELMAEHHWTNAIVVTSGFHMARALATFQKQGISVRPVACDFEGLSVVEGEMPSLRIVPIIDHLKILTLYMHEWIGWHYYAARGWI
jgi:uncharacterized SAM-binding protein YcdF (DUF218 family)